jgi:hypothetical protein
LFSTDHLLDEGMVYVMPTLVVDQFFFALGAFSM